MQGFSDRDQRAVRGRVLDRPREPAVAAPRQQVLLGPVVVDVVRLRAHDPCDSPALKPTRISLPHDQIP